MARILIVSELAERASDLIPLRRIALAARQEGHDVWLAVRDVEHATAFARLGVRVVAAPAPQRQPRRAIKSPAAFAGALYNAGFDAVPRLVLRMNAWRQLYQMLQPLVVIAHRAPTAMLATRGTRIRTVLADSGLFAPPAGDALPLLRPWQKPDAKQVAALEQAVLGVSNKALEAFKLKPLTSLSQVFQANATVLSTFPAFDPYGPRKDVNYLGWDAQAGGADAEWPTGKGPKVAVYLRAFKQVEAVLTALRERGNPAIVQIPGLPAEIIKKHAAPNLKFVDKAVDINKAAASADALMVHGGLDGVCAGLLAGKPLIVIPLSLEQRRLAGRLVGLGLALVPAKVEPVALMDALVMLGKEPKLAETAQKFAKANAGYQRGASVPALKTMFKKLTTVTAAAAKKGDETAPKEAPVDEDATEVAPALPETKPETKPESKPEQKSESKSGFFGLGKDKKNKRK